MGLNYSFNLYYRLEDLEKALLETAKIAESKDQFIDVTLPNGKTIQLPFTSGFKTDPVEFKKQGQIFVPRLDTIILFPLEPDMRGYLSTERIVIIEGKEYLAVGYIYLMIEIHHQYVSLYFTAAASEISRLFFNSKTVQGRFLDLARASGALGGVIDIDDAAEYRSMRDSKQKILTSNDEGLDWGGTFTDAHIEAILRKLEATGQNL